MTNKTSSNNNNNLLTKSTPSSSTSSLQSIHNNPNTNIGSFNKANVSLNQVGSLYPNTTNTPSMTNNTNSYQSLNVITKNNNLLNVTNAQAPALYNGNEDRQQEYSPLSCCMLRNSSCAANYLQLNHQHSKMWISQPTLRASSPSQSSSQIRSMMNLNQMTNTVNNHSGPQVKANKLLN